MRRRPFCASVAGIASLGMHGASKAASAMGLYVPAEEERHERTFMQWPVSPEVYDDPVFLEMVQQTIADIANTIVEFEPVTLLASAGSHRSARQKLSDRVELLDIPTDDLWCRDSGPLFALDHADNLMISHVQFNGWGRKQEDRNDRLVAARIAQELGLAIIPSGLVGEAGGVEQDGHGLLMAHESSWLDHHRNPGLTRAEIEVRLLRAYGAERMIWSQGVAGEDITDYHIDSLARFTGPGKVLINLPEEPDPHDPFHTAGYATHEGLIHAGLSVSVIPEPAMRRIRSKDFVASYANYYVCNGGVIAPEFGDPRTDPMAIEALKRHYPGREIVALNVDPLGELGGGIHCATQQMPAA